MLTIDLNEFPSDAFRVFLAIEPKQRELIRRYIECSDEVQSVVRSMFAVLEHEYTTDEDKKRALITIADALSLNPTPGHCSDNMDRDLIERGSAEGYPDLSRRSTTADCLNQSDAEEETFATRLSQILTEKNITQEDLADRIGCTQSAVSKMLNRNARPRRNTILKLAAALRVNPTDLWPQLEVAEILDSVADFMEDRDLTPAQAKAIEIASSQPAAKVKTRQLPSRKGR